MVGEMIKCLESGAGIGVKQNAIFACAVEIFERMDCGFVVLVTGLIAIGGQKS